MEILCHNNYCPEMECISLLEQRFDTRPTAVNSVEAPSLQTDRAVQHPRL